MKSNHKFCYICEIVEEDTFSEGFPMYVYFLCKSFSLRFTENLHLCDRHTEHCEKPHIPLKCIGFYYRHLASFLKNVCQFLIFSRLVKQLNVTKLAPIDLILKFNSNRSVLELMLKLLNFRQS